MKVYYALIVFFVGAFLFADEVSLVNEYGLLLEDLRNTDTVGYKSKSIDSVNFNLSQSSVISTPKDLDFSINGSGFFKAYDEKTKTELYTRMGSLLINGEGSLVNSDGYKIIPEFTINPKKTDKLFFENNKLIFKDGKTVVEYPFKIYLPKNGSPVKRMKNYFQFETSIETNDFKLINKSLEMGNTNVTSSLLRMVYILNSLDKSGSKRIKEIRIKISFIEKLLDAVNQWQISVNQEYVILEIKKMFTKETLDELKGLLLMKKIINDYLPFIEPDYE